MKLRVLTGRMILAVVWWTVHFPAVWAQSPVAILQQTLRAHLGAGPALQDLMIHAEITNGQGVKTPIRIYVKGSDRIRSEIGESSPRRITIFNRGQGWRGVGTALKPIPPHAVQRRPAFMPFLDLITEVDNPRAQIIDHGQQPSGASTTRHLVVRLPDPAPKERFLGRALDQQVDFFIDSRTSLVVRSQRYYRTEENMDLLVPAIVDYSDYRIVSGLAIPFSTMNTIGNAAMGTYQSRIVIQRISLNQGLSDSLFEPQAGR